MCNENVRALLAGCGSSTTTDGAGDLQGTVDTSMVVDGKAILSVKLVDAPVDNASNVFINVVGLYFHSEDAGTLKYSYCTDAEPVETTEDESDTETGTLDDDSAYERHHRHTRMEREERDHDDEHDEDEEDDIEYTTAACSSDDIRTIDLLALTEGVSATLLDGVEVPSGRYNWIRLLVADEPGTLVLDDGTEHALTIPSGHHSGLKIIGGFEVSDTGQNELVIDFDLRRSIHRRGERYVLRPVLKVIRVDDEARQRLMGQWAVTEAGEACTAAMTYIFEGADVTPDDIDGTDPDPVASVHMKMADDGVNWQWAAPLLAPGHYTVAYTCDGELDDPATDDAIAFAVQFNTHIDDDSDEHDDSDDSDDDDDLDEIEVEEGDDD